MRTILRGAIPELFAFLLGPALDTLSAAKDPGSLHGATRPSGKSDTGSLALFHSGVAPRMIRVSSLLVFAILIAFFWPCTVRLAAQTATGVPVYLDPKEPIEVRVRDLMSRMTLKEKVGQLNLPCVYVDE
ncbi:MAG TPA: hypothetical protein VFC10_11380, partial [Terriglobia bacterium]|nr:hypothetical protein [Terriglobia bacterium]